MRIFVSSSFEDLREHRAAVIRVLRQLGHEVMAMEDMVAGSLPPLTKVLETVDRCEVYVGLFAWRYGYLPANTVVPEVAGADPATSITHYEYLRAKERKLPILAFLLDETVAWPPRLIDGFELERRPQAPPDTSAIRGLRETLRQERVVSWFTTPSDLEARVSAAVTTAGLTRQLDLQAATVLAAAAGTATDSGAEQGITDAIAQASDRRRALKIDLATTWWSTRLYLIAALAERLTVARRILVVQSSGPAGVSGTTEAFIGQLPTASILTVVGPKVPAIVTFEAWLHERPLAFDDMNGEIAVLLDGWAKAFADQQFQHFNEELAKIDLSPDLLRRWFGDAMLEQPLRIADLQRASVVDLLRLLDYPSDYVPVVTRQMPAAAGGTTPEKVDFLFKPALNASLARTYLLELMDRARIG